MPDLEGRLHDAVQAATARYEPAGDLVDRIQRRVHERQRNRRLLGTAAATVAIMAGLVATTVPRAEERVVTDDPPTISSSTTNEPATTVPVQATTSTSITPASGGIDPTTPLAPRGIGPIEAGMTVREAEQASGLVLAADGSFADFGGRCYFVSLAGQPDLSIMVFSPGDQPVSDPRDGVIASVSIYAEAPTGRSLRTTIAGIGLGATEAEVRAAHGGDVVEKPHDYVPDGAYLYVLPADDPGVGIRYVLDEHRVVTKIDVGDAGAITASEGCA